MPESHALFEVRIREKLVISVSSRGPGCPRGALRPLSARHPLRTLRTLQSGGAFGPNVALRREMECIQARGYS